MRDEPQAKRAHDGRTTMPETNVTEKNLPDNVPSTDGDEAPGRAAREPIYLASQLASICDVDLKTIHNWCDRTDPDDDTPQLECFRTPGGHLRFRHSAVLRFLYRWGYPIPDELLCDRPHMLVVEPEERQREKLIDALRLLRPGEDELQSELRPDKANSGHHRYLRPEVPNPTLGLFANERWYVHIWDDPYAALIAAGERAAAGTTLDLAVLAVPMARLDVRAWIRAVRQRPATRDMRFVLVNTEDRRAPVGKEMGVVGSVRRESIDQLRTLLEEQGAELIAQLEAVRGAGGPPGSRKRRAPIAPREPIYVASQVASIWNVDLKTVHNWVERGDIEAFCTPGRHLRFRRRSLLHFLRRYNMAIPEELAPNKPRVCIVDTDVASARRLASTLGDLFEVQILTDPIAALAEIGAQCSGASLIDAVVVSFPAAGVDDRRWIQAISRHPDTRYTWVIVVSTEETHCKDWQDLGAIATVQPHAAEQVAPVLEKALGLSQ